MHQVALRMAKLALVALATLLPLCGCSNPDWSEQGVQETKRRGDQVFLALDKYFQANRTLPGSLNELVPKYLPEIPKPTVGTKEWEYRVTPQRDVCHLIFSEGGTEPRRYSRTFGIDTWSSDSGS